VFAGWARSGPPLTGTCCAETGPPGVRARPLLRAGRASEELRRRPNGARGPSVERDGVSVGAFGELGVWLASFWPIAGRSKRVAASCAQRESDCLRLRLKAEWPLTEDELWAARTDELRTASRKLQTVSCKLQAASCQL